MVVVLETVSEADASLTHLSSVWSPYQTPALAIRPMRRSDATEELCRGAAGLKPCSTHYKTQQNNVVAELALHKFIIKSSNLDRYVIFNGMKLRCLP